VGVQCDPDAVWTAVWRILTLEQIRQKFAHLSKRPTPAREAQRRALEEHIAEIQAEQEHKNAVLAARPVNPTRRTLDPRYAKGIAHEDGA
jgi:hypothetical protein